MKTHGRSLTQKQLETLKDRLNVEKQRILNSMGEKTILISFQQSESKDHVDEANENIILSQTARFTNRENLYLKKILKSLQKVEEGTYGQCEDCDTNIPFSRLAARLTSNLCIMCKEESENAEKQSVFGQKSKSLGRHLMVSRAQS